MLIDVKDDLNLFIGRKAKLKDDLSLSLSHLCRRDLSLLTDWTPSGLLQIISSCSTRRDSENAFGPSLTRPTTPITLFAARIHDSEKTYNPFP